MRLFAIGFTKKRQNQLKKTCYASAAQQKLIRKKMREIMQVRSSPHDAPPFASSSPLPSPSPLPSLLPPSPQREASTVTLNELVNKFIPEVIGKEIEKACHGVYPLQNVHIRKVKMLKKPKFDLTKLLDIHGDGGLAPVGTDKGESVKVADLGEGAEAKEVVGA